MDPISGDEAKLRTFELPERTAVPFDVRFLGDGPVSGASAYMPQDVVSSSIRRITAREGAPPGGSQVLLVPPGTGSAHLYAVNQMLGTLLQFYLGPFAYAPYEDQQGNPVQPGHTYFNTIDNQTYVYTSTGQWNLFGEPVPASIRVYVYSLLADTNTLPALDDFGRALEFDIERGDAVSLYLNGARQVGGLDYVLHPDHTITLPVPMEAGNIVEIQVLGRPSLSFPGSPLPIDTYLWLTDGEVRSFPLRSQGIAVYPGTAAACLVAIDGALQDPTRAFTVTDETITFAVPPSLGSVIWMVVYALDPQLGDLATLQQDVAALQAESHAGFGAALDLKAPILNPEFLGMPVAPNPPPSSNSYQIATTSFVVGGLVTVKADIDALEVTAEANKTAVANLTASQSAGLLGYATKALLDADLSKADGVLALVTNDPTPANNATYRKTGTPGGGSWVLAADRVSLIEANVATLQPATALRTTPRNEGELFAVLDSADRRLAVFEGDGTLHAKFGLTAAAPLLKTGTADAGYTLGLDTANLLPGHGGLTSAANVEEHLFALTDSNDRLLLYIRKDGTVIGKFSVDLAEVAAARGSRALLGDRLDQALTTYGLPKEPIAGEWYLRETRQRLRLLALAETGRLTIAAIGDSWTHNAARWSGTLATAITGTYGDAGAGWTGFAWGGGNTALVNGNARASVVGYTPSATSWTVTYGTAVGPDVCSITSSTVGAIQTVTGPASCSAVVLFFLGGTGNLRYRWNGGSWTALALAGSGLQTSTLTGLPAGTWTLELEVVSNSCTLFGLDVQKTTNGVRFHKLGATGSRAEQWAADAAADWRAGLTALAPNLVILMHGTNDQGASRTPAAFRADITTLITSIRTALPSADILLVAPCENGRGLAVLMSDYAAQLRELAALYSCAFLDLQPYFGLVPADYASGSTRPWFNVDTVHPEPASGGRAIMDAIYRLLTTR